MASIVALLTGLLLSLPAAAEPPYGLELPLDCEPGVDCWVLRHVDHDPGPGARDYRCGGLTGDGHQGTDVAIRDLAAMVAGVEVRAAAPGVVLGLRDGMPDIGVEASGVDAIAGRECGNGVRLDHGEGWTTQYCHLRRGSLRVAEGDRVRAGQPLGLVGVSGDTSFPHLHFELRRGERVIDPFAGLEREFGCRVGERPFWNDRTLRRLAYQPILLTNAGFATTAPEGDDIRRGYHHEERLPVSSPALVLWAEAYHVEPGDRLRFTLRDPGGDIILDETLAIEDGKARWWGFAGARRPGAHWPAGVYRGEIVLERGTTAAVQRAALERQVVLR